MLSDAPLGLGDKPLEPSSASSLVVVDRQQVGLGVEDPPVQVDLVSVREEQVEVLEGLPQEE